MFVPQHCFWNRPPMTRQCFSHLATSGGQPATGYYCELGRGRQCLCVIFVVLSPITQTVFDLCTVSWTLYRPFFPRHYLNVATSDPLSLVTHLGRGRRYLLDISLCSHGRLPISALSSGPAIVYLCEYYLTLATSDLFSGVLRTRTWAPVSPRHLFSELASNQYVNV